MKSPGQIWSETLLRVQRLDAGVLLYKHWKVFIYFFKLAHKSQYKNRGCQFADIVKTLSLTNQPYYK